MSEESKKIDVMVDSEGTVVPEQSSTKKKKKKTKSRDSFSEGISESEKEKLSDDGSVVKKKSKKKKRSDSVSESEKTSDEVMVESESIDVVKKTKKKKNKEKNVDSVSVSEDSVENSKEISVDSVLDDAKKKKKKTVKRKLDETDLVAEEGNLEKESKKKRKKVKPSVDLVEVEGNNNDSEKVEEKDLNSVTDGEKKKKLDGESKKKSKKVNPSVDSQVVENAEDGEKKEKKKKKKLSEENNDDGTTKHAEKKEKVSEKKERKKKKKVSESAEAEEDNEDGTTKDAEKKKRKKKKEKVSDEDVVTTPSSSSKSNKKVKFSDQVEVFPSNEDKDSENEEDSDKEVEVVRGKRFTKEEDALVKQAVLDYIDNHALGEKGLEMVMNCKKHPEIKGCWQEIESALPWRAKSSVYYRAHNLFEEGSKGVWTPEDLELVKQFQAKHGNDWKTIADGMGKHRVHVKDAWRRIRLNMNKGHWSREEYQTLFDLVNTDIKMKAYKEKHSKHGMLRDNIPWMAISDKLGTRGHVHCCEKWYNQLTSPMVKSGIWANVDDYRLLEELMRLDAACIDDVEWDELLENRDGYACRKRWNQMVLHIGSQGSQTFSEQVEILSQRYCPDLAEEVENYENRPYDPED